MSREFILLITDYDVIGKYSLEIIKNLLFLVILLNCQMHKCMISYIFISFNFLYYRIVFHHHSG